MVSDGQGNAIVWRSLKSGRTALGNPKPGNWVLTEYFSKLPKELQAENMIREHMGQEKI